MNCDELEYIDLLDPFEKMPYSYEKGKLLSCLEDSDRDYLSRRNAMNSLESLVQKGEFPEIALNYDKTELLLLIIAWKWDVHRNDHQVEFNVTETLPGVD